MMRALARVDSEAKRELRLQGQSMEMVKVMGKVCQLGKRSESVNPG